MQLQCIFCFNFQDFCLDIKPATGFGSWKPCSYCDHLAWSLSFSLFGFLDTGIKLLEGLPTDSGRSIGESSISGTSHRTVFWFPAAKHLLKQFGINRKTLNIALEKHSHFDTDPFLPMRLWMHASGRVGGRYISAFWGRFCRWPWNAQKSLRSVAIPNHHTKPMKLYPAVLCLVGESHLYPWFRGASVGRLVKYYNELSKWYRRTYSMTHILWLRPSKMELPILEPRIDIFCRFQPIPIWAHTYILDMFYLFPSLLT